MSFSRHQVIVHSGRKKKKRKRANRIYKGKGATVAHRKVFYARDSTTGGSAALGHSLQTRDEGGHVEDDRCSDAPFSILIGSLQASKEIPQSSHLTAPRVLTFSQSTALTLDRQRVILFLLKHCSLNVLLFLFSSFFFFATV